MSRSSRTTPDGRGPTALTGGLPGDEERAFPLTPEEGEGEEEEEHDLLHDQHDEHQSGLPMHWGYAGWAFLLTILISVPSGGPSGLGSVPSLMSPSCFRNV